MKRIVQSPFWALVGWASVLVIGCSTSDVDQGKRHEVLKPAIGGSASPGAGEVLKVAQEPAAEAGASAAGDGSSAEAKPKLDPVVANGPIFEGWPKPRLAIVFTGELDGYIEPCGCAGLENQLGGLKRRHTFVKQLEAQGWPLVLVDVGGLTKRLGPQTEIKYRHELDALREIGYAAIEPGINELQLGADAVAYPLINLEPEKNPMVSANVSIYGTDSGLTRPYRVIEAGGKRIGVTGVLGSKHRETLKTSEEVIVEDPTVALSRVAPKLAAEKCDLQVLLVHGDPAEADDLRASFRSFKSWRQPAAPRSRPRDLARSRAARPPGSRRAKRASTPSCWGFSTTPSKPTATSACRSTHGSPTRPRCKQSWSRTRRSWRR